MGLTIVLQGLHCRKCGEHSVAVVPGPTTIEPALSIEVWCPRPQTLTPAHHRRLLVQVPIHQHRIRDTARKLQQQQRRAVAVLQHLQGAAR